MDRAQDDSGADPDDDQIDRRLPALSRRESRTGRDPCRPEVVGEAEGHHVQALKGAIADAQQKMAQSGA
jgi:hypothetical protein